jgi:hypothetical protein
MAGDSRPPRNPSVSTQKADARAASGAGELAAPASVHSLGSGPARAARSPSAIARLIEALQPRHRLADAAALEVLPWSLTPAPPPRIPGASLAVRGAATSWRPRHPRACRQRPSQRHREQPPPECDTSAAPHLSHLTRAWPASPEIAGHAQRRRPRRRGAQVLPDLAHRAGEGGHAGCTGLRFAPPSDSPPIGDRADAFRTRRHPASEVPYLRPPRGEQPGRAQLVD